MDSSVNRRGFIIKFFYSASTILLFSLAGSAGCRSKKKEEPKGCSDLSGLSEDEKNAREKLGYRDKSPDKERTCLTCSLFLPNSQDTTCGQCTLIKGPVHSEGTCVYWVAKNQL